MKLLCYADLHATDGDEMSFTNPTITLQHYRVQKFYKDLRAIYDEHKCDGVIDLGDTTGDRSSIPVPTIEVLGSGMELIPDSTWNIKLIGNHEQFLRNCSISTRRLFEHKFTVISENKVFDFDGWTAFFCSYPANHDTLASWITQTALKFRQDGKILFGHFQVAGCTMPTGVALNGVPANVLKPFELCLLGHIHLPQSLSDRIHYIGSPFQQNWGEAGQQKRVAILDTCDPPKLAWVELEGYPLYQQVSLPDFKKLAKTDDENRYTVALANHEEAEEFYRHPLFSRHPAMYAYSEVETPDEAVEHGWSLEAVCKRWVEAVPLAKVGIEVEEQDMLDIGLSLANSKV